MVTSGCVWVGVGVGVCSLDLLFFLLFCVPFIVFSTIGKPVSGPAHYGNENENVELKRCGR